jgi:PEP-CTERM motif-containing protein
MLAHFDIRFLQISNSHVALHDITTLVPEPGTGLLVMTGVLGLAATRRRRA